MTERVASLEEVYVARTPRSRELFERASNYTSGPIKGAYFYPPYPLGMERGQGCYLYDLDGHRYVDFANHHTAQILGHNHPKVMEAVKVQMARGVAVGAPMGVEAEIAAVLAKRRVRVRDVRGELENGS